MIVPPRPRLPVHRRSIMFYLIAVTLLWAISFSLIGEYLAGQVDSYFAVLTRILLACLLFLPLLRPRRLPRHMAGGLLLVGARSEEHTSELQSRPHLVCRLLLEKKKKRQPP